MLDANANWNAFVDMMEEDEDNVEKSSSPQRQKWTNNDNASSGYMRLMAMLMRGLPAPSIERDDEWDMISLYQRTINGDEDDALMAQDAADLLFAAHAKWLDRLCERVTHLYDVPEGFDIKSSARTAFVNTLAKHKRDDVRFTSFSVYHIFAAILQDMIAEHTIEDPKLLHLTKVTRSWKTHSTTTQADSVEDLLENLSRQNATFEGHQEKNVAAKAVRNMVKDFLPTLTRREQVIWEARALTRASNQKEHTLETLSCIYDISRERVRQIENRATEKFVKFLTDRGITSTQDLF